MVGTNLVITEGIDCLMKDLANIVKIPRYLLLGNTSTSTYLHIQSVPYCEYLRARCGGFCMELRELSEHPTSEKRKASRLSLHGIQTKYRKSEKNMKI